MRATVAITEAVASPGSCAVGGLRGNIAIAGTAGRPGGRAVDNMRGVAIAAIVRGVGAVVFLTVMVMSARCAACIGDGVGDTGGRTV